MSNALEKFKLALQGLNHALEFEKKVAEDDFYFGGIAKAFETAIESGWKYFRAEALSAGLDVPSPRDAIKQAGSLGLIDNVEEWLNLLKVRNIAVHDYLNIPKDEYLTQIKKFASMTRGFK